MVRSYEQDASKRPFGDHATVLTRSLCSSNLAAHSPLSTSQMRMVVSSDGEAKYCPSGDQAMRLISFACPCRAHRKVRPGTGELPIPMKSLGSPLRFDVSIARSPAYTSITQRSASRCCAPSAPIVRGRDLRLEIAQIVEQK